MPNKRFERGRAKAARRSSYSLAHGRETNVREAEGHAEETAVQARRV